MPRDHARIRLDLAADETYRSLTHDAQWLYKKLLIDPTLNFLGIADWRPARIAATTAELSAGDVELFAYELEQVAFILVDRDSEEVLIRSFVKHDGLLESPNMVKALSKVYPLIASSVLRAVAVEQVAAQRERQPDAKGWTGIGALLERPRLTFAEGVERLSPNPSGNPSGNPSVKGSGRGSATPILLSSLPPNSPKSNRPYVSGPPTAIGFGSDD